MWLRGLMRWAGLNGWAADLAVVAFILSQTFLNYTQTASSYIPGLAMLLLGCYLSARETASVRSSAWAVSARERRWRRRSASGFCTCGLCPPPCCCRCSSAALTGRACGWRSAPPWCVALLIAAGLCRPLVKLDITTVGALKAWIDESSHGVAKVHGLDRAAFGFARSFINMGNDGVLFKRYLRHDELNPDVGVRSRAPQLVEIGALLSLSVGSRRRTPAFAAR